MYEINYLAILALIIITQTRQDCNCAVMPVKFTTFLQLEYMLLA